MGEEGLMCFFGRNLSSFEFRSFCIFGGNDLSYLCVLLLCGKKQDICENAVFDVLE